MLPYCWWYWRCCCCYKLLYLLYSKIAEYSTTIILTLTPIAYFCASNCFQRLFVHSVQFSLGRARMLDWIHTTILKPQ